VRLQCSRSVYYSRDAARGYGSRRVVGNTLETQLWAAK